MSRQPATASKNSERARRWAPLVAIGSSLAIAIFALPSVLNLPQANPAQVAEYAPVPPESEEAAPPGGNFNGLGLGGSSTIGEGVGPVAAPPIQGSQRSPFRCVIVNGIPRQTEDPLSPPCVSFFSGDNGGSTYRGVTKKDINVVIYVGCAVGTGGGTFAPTSQGEESPRCGTIVDLDRPPSDNDFVYTRALKRYSVYFNTRYQTYGRHVHMWAFYGHYTTAVVGSGGCQEDCRRQDAAQTISQLNPFAVLTVDDRGAMDAYSEAMAQKGILNFGGSAPHNEAFYRRYPGLLWSYLPSVEQQAELYASVLCKQVVGRNVSFSGVAGDRGKKRKLGMIFSNAEGDTYYPAIRFLTIEKLRKCGYTAPIPAHGYADGGCSLSCAPQNGPQHATELADLRRQGVTTILWIGAQTGEFANQANRIGWRPEWVLFGDGIQEDFVTGRYGNQNVWSHMWIVSNITKVGRQGDQLCALAMREVDPNFPDADITWGCGFYNDLRQLFSGIQVAGPKISPQTVDSGFHSVPAIASINPLVPACFYRPKDYTCVKDAITMWWDPDGQIPGWTGQGCFRVVDGGKRYLADTWPERELSSGAKRGDVCNGYTVNGSLNPYQQTS